METRPGYKTIALVQAGDRMVVEIGRGAWILDVM